MDSLPNELHFILFPLMAQGHMIPMVDIARILAQRGATVTIITTPLNANRFKTVISRAIEAKLQIQMLELQFPTTESRLPQGCESLDMLPSADLTFELFVATEVLQKPAEKMLQGLKPSPSCIISDTCLPWTMDVAKTFHIPRLSFVGMGSFPLVCMHSLFTSKIIDGITSDSEHFVLPGLPDRVEVTKPKVAGVIQGGSSSTDFYKRMGEAERETYGILVNSFRELEPEYAKKYEKVEGKRVWCIGPVSLCNENNLDKAERGSKAAINGQDCLKWLNQWEPNSVLYVCLGSLSRLSTAQMIELGLGLELSNQPFIWCVRQGLKELESWFSEEGFKERVKDRGLIIHGWAPQVLILSHQAIGGFLTHCGWNSTLEGICARVPMITWPLFGEQFFNEHFIVEILKIGVRIGVEVPIFVGEEEKTEVLVKKDGVKLAVDNLMDVGAERGERRKRARDLGDMANKAMEEEGSSHLNMTLVIQDIMEQLASTKK